MSVNKYAPHVLVLPEDDANTQIANGFQLALPGQNFRKLQILPEAGGWTRVRDSFLSDHVAEMERNPNRYMVLIIDLDGRPERPQSIHDLIPPTLADKVFIVGAARTPEELKDLGSYETIGRALEEDCAAGTVAIWGHELLRHNQTEIVRMRERLCPILFGIVG
jgi:hypothetical protein